MDGTDSSRLSVDLPAGQRSVQCSACQAALRSPGRDTVSFLLLDRLTIPLVGCEDHREQFGALCELAADQDAELLNHRPAGGLPCPGCRHARYDAQQSVVPVGGGGLALLACSSHQSDIVARFRAGLQIRQRLDASLDAF